MLGRDGVGRGAVVAALASAGVTVTPDDFVADLRVVVIAETLKPEDQAMMGVDRPTVAVLNKADLTGFGAGGPLTLAHRHAATYRALTGVPTVPMVALLATADLDGEMISALRTLVSTPADLTSTDAFVQSRHPLSQDVRRRLLDTLDRFGIAHAVVAIARASTPPTAGPAPRAQPDRPCRRTPRGRRGPGAISPLESSDYRITNACSAIRQRTVDGVPFDR